MDFNKTDFGTTDILRMISPNAFIYLTTLSVSIGLYFLTLSKKANTLFIPIIIVLALFSLFSFSQFPALSDKDYFLHGRLDSIIISEGHLPSVSEQGNYYVQWPLAIIFRAVTSIITGLPEIDSTRVLSFIFPILLVLFFYILARVKLGPYLAGIVPALFLVSNLVYPTDEIDHFCPQLFALTLFLLALYLVTKETSKKDGRIITCLILLVSFSIILSHPITPFFLLPSFMAIWFFNFYLKRRNRKTSFTSINFVLVILLLLLFLAWSFLYAGNSFDQGFTQIMSGNGHLASQVQVYDFQTELLVFFSYYWKIIALLILLPALFVTFRVLRKGNPEQEKILTPLCWVLLGCIIGGLVFSVTSFFDLTRVLTFILIPACFITVFFLTKHINVKILSFLVVLLVIPGFFVIYGFSNQFTVYQHSSEISACQWLSIKNVNHELVTSDYNTMIIYSYYDWRSWPTGIVGDEQITDYSLPISSTHPFFQGQFMVRSIRQDIMQENYLMNETMPGKEYWSQIDLYASNSYNKIFSNGNIEIFSKQEK